MLHPRRNPDHIALTNCLDRSSPFLNPTFAIRHDQNLTERMTTNSEISLVVSGLLVERVPLVLDVGSVHLIYPILRFDFFKRHGNGLFSVVQNLGYISCYCFGQTGLLPFRFARPQLHDDMRHLFVSLLRPRAATTLTVAERACAPVIGFK